MDIERMKNEINWFKNGQRWSTLSGIALSLIGTFSGIHQAITPPAETAIDYLPQLGMLAIGVLSFSVANKLRKNRKTLENMKTAMEILSTANDLLEQRLHLEDFFEEQFGPNRPIFIDLTKPPGQEQKSVDN